MTNPSNPLRLVVDTRAVSEVHDDKALMFFQGEMVLVACI